MPQITDRNIIEALRGAQQGIQKYSEIMGIFRNVNVYESLEFQTKYNHYYKVRQKSGDWYKEYYRYMEELKGKEVNFKIILLHIKDKLNKYEPSFSSKLLATHNPEMPIWDKHVLSNIGLKAPAYSDKYKLSKAINVYEDLCRKYIEINDSPNGNNIIRMFNMEYPGMAWISRNKKIDFVLWQLRN